MFRREWRRQALILILLIVAVAATIVGLGVASNATYLKADPAFGTANTIITLPGSDPNLSGDLAVIQQHFGLVEVIEHQSIPVPGSVSTIDVRAQNPDGPYGHVTLRLDSGRYPSGPGEVAVTKGVADTIGLRVGGEWTEGGRRLNVVGVVENPLDLTDQFALVAPGQATPPSQVSILLNDAQGVAPSLQLPSSTGISIDERGTGGRTTGEAVVLVLGTLGLLFVGLMAVAGFTVMAQRRMRALGMLGSLGARDRHIRLVMLANGLAVGFTAAVAGAAVGLAAWFAFVPSLQSLAGHRVDRFALPWWAIGAAMLLTVLTAVAAAWWPARAAARVPVVAALSGRPPRPHPPHRFAVSGAVLLGSGIVLLAFADQNRVGFIIGGTLATALGVLFLAPLEIRVLAFLAGRASIAVRLAVRDLVRYQARSGAALGAITLAIGIAATIALSAAAAQTPSGPGNLPSDQLMLYLTPAGGLSQIPLASGAQQLGLTSTVARLAAGIHAESVLPLEQAYNPLSTIQPAQPGGPGSGAQPAGYITASMAMVDETPQGEQINSPNPLYVATPAVLAFYGIKPAQIDPAADVVTSRTDLGGFRIFAPDPGSTSQSGQLRRSPGMAHPDTQLFQQLPRYTSAPGILITDRAMRTLGLQALPAAWLIQARQPLTAAQIASARTAAAAAGLYIETRTAPKSLAPLRNWSTAAGILLALGVLGMTVGLIRSESANDLRTLTATGATTFTRRMLTGATSAALALLGAVLGTAGAYAALIAWHRSDLAPLGHVPVANLVLILVGLPAIAGVGGWLLAGAEPAGIGRRPVE
jgi:putative ABC transport system permease protein